MRQENREHEVLPPLAGEVRVEAPMQPNEFDRDLEHEQPAQAQDEEEAGVVAEAPVGIGHQEKDDPEEEGRIESHGIRGFSKKAMEAGDIAMAEAPSIMA